MIVTATPTQHEEMRCGLCHHECALQSGGLVGTTLSLTSNGPGIAAELSSRYGLAPLLTVHQFETNMFRQDLRQGLARCMEGCVWSLSC